ncbi:hypothetical protein BDZ97DRAFT_1913004 [Flammula alnicola]|nr:hypothetical protein BDZ97DRAFT_1913004 [Flammula alnicola]
MPKSFLAPFKRKRISPRSNPAATATSANTATSDTPASPDCLRVAYGLDLEHHTDYPFVLKGVGALAPVPFLKDSIDLASSLVDMVQNMTQNHEDLENVIREICQLLVCISSECARFQQSGESMPKEFAPTAEALVRFGAVVSQIHFLAACWNDNERLLREIREVLDSLRDMSLYRPPAKPPVSPVRVQLYHGSQIFEKLMKNRNIDDDLAAEDHTTPIQVY